jgi:hypothetical protein
VVGREIGDRPVVTRWAQVGNACCSFVIMRPVDLWLVRRLFG